MTSPNARPTSALDGCVRASHHVIVSLSHLRSSPPRVRSYLAPASSPRHPSSPSRSLARRRARRRQPTSHRASSFARASRASHLGHDPRLDPSPSRTRARVPTRALESDNFVERNTDRSIDRSFEIGLQRFIDRTYRFVSSIDRRSLDPRHPDPRSPRGLDFHREALFSAFDRSHASTDIDRSIDRYRYRYRSVFDRSVVVSIDMDQSIVRTEKRFFV